MTDKQIQQMADFFRHEKMSEQQIENRSNYARMNVSLKTEEVEDGVFHTKLKFTPIGGTEIVAEHRSDSEIRNLKGLINLLLADGYK